MTTQVPTKLTTCRASLWVSLGEQWSEASPGYQLDLPAPGLIEIHTRSEKPRDQTGPNAVVQ